MELSRENTKRASEDLKAMVDAVRDEAPGWDALMASIFGTERPTLGTVRRAFANPKVASLLRSPTERAAGRRLREPDDLAEAFHEIASGPADGDHRLISQAYAIASSLEHRVLESA